MIRYMFEVKPQYAIGDKFKGRNGALWTVDTLPFGAFSLSGYSSNMMDIRADVNSYLNLQFEEKAADNEDSKDHLYILKNEQGELCSFFLHEINKHLVKVK